MRELLDNLFEGLQQVIEFEKDYSDIYKIHKYWARKPWYVVEKYISKYSHPGDIVLDPFCGSGSTGVESIVLGRNFQGYDLNPIAVWISEQTLQNRIDISRLKSDFLQISDVCKDKILNLYLTDDKCPACGQSTVFKHINIGPKFHNLYSGAIYCPNCFNSRARQKRDLTYNENNRVALNKEIKIPYWYPDKPFPKKFYKDRFSYKGILNVSDMFTRRNLFSLALLLDTIKNLHSPYEKLITLAFTNTVLHSSKLKAENVRPLSVNNFWVPDDYLEENVWFRFEDRFNHLISAKEMLEKKISRNGEPGKYNVETKSAIHLGLSNYADYIFTDPPYGDTIQYSELSFIWNAWIYDDYNIEEEIIINPVQKKNADSFIGLLSNALLEIYRSLKNDKYFTLCFHNKEYKIWKKVINNCKDIGFVLEDIQIYDVYGNPYNQTWAKFSPKSDIYVTFRKGTHNIDISRYFERDMSLQEIIQDVLIYMKHHNSSLDVIKIYDVTISYIIWNLFYNKGTILIDSFDTRQFSLIVDQLMEKL